MEKMKEEDEEEKKKKEMKKKRAVRSKSTNGRPDGTSEWASDAISVLFFVKKYCKDFVCLTVLFIGPPISASNWRKKQTKKNDGAAAADVGKFSKKKWRPLVGSFFVVVFSSFCFTSSGGGRGRRFKVDSFFYWSLLFVLEIGPFCAFLC